MFLVTGLALAFRNFAVFSGRASRGEYWSFAAALGVVFFLLMLFGSVVRDFLILALVLSVLAGIPEISIAVRRLHDTGRSGWFLLLYLIPGIGSIIVFILMLLPGERGANSYGPPRLPLGQLAN